MDSSYSDGVFYKSNTIFNPFIKKVTENIIPGMVIDFGCGVGTNIYNLQMAGWSVYGVEREPIAVKKAREMLGGACIIDSDVNELDFNYLPYFDLALCNYMLQHLTKREAIKLLDNLSTRINRRAYFILSFFDEREGITFLEIEAKLRQIGWELKKIKRWERLDTSHGLPHTHKGIESFWEIEK